LGKLQRPLSACDAPGQDSRHLGFRRDGLKAGCNLPLALPKLLVAEPFSVPGDKPLLADPKCLEPRRAFRGTRAVLRETDGVRLAVLARLDPFAGKLLPLLLPER